MSENIKSFIEVQFPVSKISKESYKERKAGSNQTLTGLGKWWGRKPLILVRAALLGLLLPASNDPVKDREIFLKILSMDDEGLIKRKNKKIPINLITDHLSPSEIDEYFEIVTKNKLKLKDDISSEKRETLQLLVFKRLSYDEKLKYCMRPEELETIGVDQWEVVNDHLNTNANNIEELTVELGKKKFNRTTIVGDCFCGGGSIPFEAARMGCSTFASDLNPLSGLLTWASLNLLNKNKSEAEELRKFQQRIFKQVVKQYDGWRIEKNEKNWLARFYIYCNELVCPECKCLVPLSPTWVINDPLKTVAELKYNKGAHSYDLVVKNNASKDDIENAKKSATIKGNNFECPNCDRQTPITAIRKDRKNNDGKVEYGLRMWKKKEFYPSDKDVFKERLFCIKYLEKFDHKTWDDVIKKPAPATDACYGNAYYCTPTKEDYKREEKVFELIKERFNKWQSKGYLPISEIEKGYNTSQVIRERGYKYWHQLFNNRQLLLHGLLMELIDKESINKEQKITGLLGINRCIDWNSKLTRWLNHRSTGGGAQTFSNQALNTLYNYCCRTLSSQYLNWNFDIRSNEKISDCKIALTDARNINNQCDIWITDPPYADAINYHELSEYFLAWDAKLLKKIFPDWYTDSKRALAVQGKGEAFNKSMIEVYQNLANHTSNNGTQIIMFTHQDVKVWAELALIVWSAGLRVSAAWNIATETEASGLKQGNYVKGTVLLILKKQASEGTAYLDELYPEIEEEAKSQIDNMRNLDDKDDSNFSDSDYLLAAYAASLKVLTSYQAIEDIDVSYELSKDRNVKEISPIEKIITEAVKIAYDYLIPSGFDSFTWKTLQAEERFFIKGLDSEKNGIYQLSSYQELARGFGVKDYNDLLANKKANKARLKSASEFAMKGMSENDRFGSSLLRNVLVSIHLAIKAEDTTPGKNWLKNELPGYWNQRSSIIELLDYISTLENIKNMPHWEKDAKYAKRLRELVNSDGV